jgi:hypothetical protein
MDGREEFWPDDTVKSISLADMLPPKPPPRGPLAVAFPFFGRMLNLVKIGLMAWGAISLGAVAAMSAFYLSGKSDAPLIATATTHRAASPTSLAPPAERLAALIDAPLPPTITAPPFSLKTPAFVPLAASPTPPPVAMEPAPVVEARLPRARPDEPIITGSIAASAPKRDWTARPHRSTLDPCNALKNLGAPFLFGNRCGPYTHVYPAPPREFDRVTIHPAPPAPGHAPRPYQPPVVYQQ